MTDIDIAAIEAEHQMRGDPVDMWMGERWCSCGAEYWPCDTRQVLDALRAAEPPTGARLVLVSEDAGALFFGRSESGDLLTIEWGEPDEHGWYSPTIKRHAGNNILRAAEAREKALREALTEIRNGGRAMTEPTVDTYWHTLSDCWCTGNHDMDEAAYMNGKLAERRTRAGRLPAIETEALPSDSLDAAWADAEAALPEGVLLYALIHLNPDPAFNQMAPNEWRVEVGNAKDRAQDVRAYGDTPAAALRALAAKLREA